MQNKVSFIKDVNKIKGLSAKERKQSEEVCKNFTFFATDYYLSLIDWQNPDDPLRRIIFPQPEELETWGKLDASNEKSYTVLPGLQHKYGSTALLLLSNRCAGQCRYCFRKRIFITDEEHAAADPQTALHYIRKHPEITNVLISGGDPLMLSTARLANVIEALRDIAHIQIIRIGTKVPAYMPQRILNDEGLVALFSRFSTSEKRMYLVTHFCHVNELTEQAVEAVSMLRRAGAIVVNQTPLIAGVNDDPATLAALFAKTSFLGITPYYVFQCRPAVGNRGYAVPLERGYDVFEEARSRVSGLAKRARYVMSHETGKIEIMGRTPGRIFFKYHRAAHGLDSYRILICRSNPQGYWLEDFEELEEAELRPLSAPHAYEECRLDVCRMDDQM